MHDLIDQHVYRSDRRMVEPIASSLLTAGGGPAQKAEETPRSQDKKSCCRKQFQEKDIRLRRYWHLALQFQGNQQPKLIPEEDHQPGERPTRRASQHDVDEGTSLSGEDNVKAKRSRAVGIWNLAIVQHGTNVEHEFSQ